MYELNTEGKKKKKTEAWPFSVTTKCPERLIKPLCACWSRHEHLPGLCELWEFSGLQPPALCLDQWSFTTLVLGLLVDDGSTDWRNSFSAEFPRLVLGSPNPSCICSVPLAGHVISAPLGFSLSCDLRSVNRQKAEEDRGFCLLSFHSPKGHTPVLSVGRCWIELFHAFIFQCSTCQQ